MSAVLLNLLILAAILWAAPRLGDIIGDIIATILDILESK